MAGDLLREVRDQPRLLARLRGEASTRARRFAPADGGGTLWLVGCGDMHFAAQAAADAVGCRGVGSVAALRSMDVRWWKDAFRPGDRMVGASISGRTPRTVEALRTARQRQVRTLALTDAAGSPICDVADEVLVLGTATPADPGELDIYPGYTSEVPQTRTFLATLWLMLEAAESHGGLAFVTRADVPELLEERLPALEESARCKVEEVAARGPIAEVLVLGSGPHRAIASYGAAKLLEYAIPARAQCLEEFNHLEMFLLQRGSVLAALAPDAASAERWATLRGLHDELGASRLEWVAGADLPPLDAPASLFPAAVALQLQAREFAAVLGRDLDRWVGGVRRDQIFDLSRRTVRGQ